MYTGLLAVLDQVGGYGLVSSLVLLPLSLLIRPLRGVCVKVLYSTLGEDGSVRTNPGQKSATTVTVCAEVVSMNEQNREHIKRATEVNEIVEQMYCGGHPKGPRWQLVLLHVSLAQELHDSVLTLLKTNRNIRAAIALLRLSAEAACHGLWALRCADDEQIDAMLWGDEPPGTFRERLDAVGSALKTSDGFERVVGSWRYLNGLTDGRYEQLIQRVSVQGDILPTFRDADIEQTIRFATSDLVVLAVPILVEEGRLEDARRLEREFIERFRIEQTTPQEQLQS
jgi:hypothetical protein